MEPNITEESAYWFTVIIDKRLIPQLHYSA